MRDTMKEAQRRVPVMSWVKRMFYRYRLAVQVLLKTADSISECTSLTTSSLYEASKITVFDSYLLLFHYVTKHSLTHKAFTELLQLVSAFLPPSVKIPGSVHRLKHLFSNLFPHSQPTVHYYCDVCLASTSQGSVCSTVGCYGRHQGTFLTMPIGPQIKRMMEGK